MSNLDFELRNINKGDFFKLKAPFEKIKFILRYGILAPSTHNSQPWLFKIENDSCKIFYDSEKYTIKEADPIKRDLYISFGCLLENIIVAASYFKVFRNLNYILKDNLVAEVTFGDLERKDIQISKELADILDAVPKRVNVRGIFEQKPVESEIIKKIQSLDNKFPELRLDLVHDKEKINKLATLTAEGLRIAYQSSNFRKEMSSWMNSSFSKKREGIPGYSLRMPALISLIFPTLVRFFNIGKAVGALNYKSISSAPLVLIISSKENSPLSWLEVGRLFERITLELNSKELKTSIFVASIEIGDLYKQVQKVINSGLVAQLLFCVGYMNFEQRPNLRHPVEAKLIP